MNLFKEINHNKNLNKKGKYILREAVRAIILNVRMWCFTNTNKKRIR